MNSLILRVATGYLHPLLLLFSVFLLLRGHNEPGGGFTGGLVAAAAFCLQVVAFDVPTARRALPADPRSLVAAGLLLAGVSGLVPLLVGHPFLTGEWFKLELPGVAALKLGTPVLFDIGVYCVVIGLTLLLVFSVAEEEEAA